MRCGFGPWDGNEGEDVKEAARYRLRQKMFYCVSTITETSIIILIWWRGPAAVSVLFSLFSSPRHNRKRRIQAVLITEVGSVTVSCTVFPHNTHRRLSFYSSLSVSLHTHTQIFPFTHRCADLTWWVMARSAHWYEAATWLKMTKTSNLNGPSFKSVSRSGLQRTPLRAAISFIYTERCMTDPGDDHACS